MRYKKAIVVLGLIGLLDSLFLGVQLSCAAEDRKD